MTPTAVSVLSSPGTSVPLSSGRCHAMDEPHRHGISVFVSALALGYALFRHKDFQKSDLTANVMKSWAYSLITSAAVDPLSRFELGASTWLRQWVMVWY